MTDTSTLGRETDANRHDRVTVESQIDLDRALLRMGGDTHMFVNFAERFVKDIPPMMQRLLTLVEQGSDAGALILLHGLKGMAGTIGAHLLAHMAADLETCLKRGGSSASAAGAAASLTTCASTIIPLLHSMINAVRARAPQRRTATLPEPHTGERVLDELEVLLQNANMRALDVAADLLFDHGVVTHGVMGHLNRAGSAGGLGL